jgi:hypothetical protein
VDIAQPDKPGRFTEEQDFSIVATKLAGMGLLRSIGKVDIGPTVGPLFEIIT